MPDLTTADYVFAYIIKEHIYSQTGPFAHYAEWAANLTGKDLFYVMQHTMHGFSDTKKVFETFKWFKRFLDMKVGDIHLELPRLERVEAEFHDMEHQIQYKIGGIRVHEIVMRHLYD